MSERKGTKGLELWCRKMTEGYPGVKIDNMTTSWRDGLAFCAIIHHFRPDLIDFSKLNKDDVYLNNELAFRVAEEYLGIPALLEPEDMVEYSVPDRLSILTYLSQFYQTFAVKQGSSRARVAPKRAQASPDHGIVSPASTSPPTKVALTGVGRLRREPCAKCGLPVFLAERLNVGKLHFHRTCFRCARCRSPLTLANYYETESSEYCCEVCPDEDKVVSKNSNENLLLGRSMSDEEKRASLATFSDEPDTFSTEFETALDSIENSSKKSEFTQARSQFFRTHLETSDSGLEEEKPPDIPISPPELDTSEKIESVFETVHSGSSYLDLVNNSDRITDKNQGSSHIELPESRNIVTKDESHDTDTSLVKARMRLFENNNLKSDVNIVSPSSKMPRDKSSSTAIPIVKIEELESFDDISSRMMNNKTNQETESLPYKDTLKHSITNDINVKEPEIVISARSSKVEDIVAKRNSDHEDNEKVIHDIKQDKIHEISFLKEVPQTQAESTHEITEIKEDKSNVVEESTQKDPHHNSSKEIILHDDIQNIVDITKEKDFPLEPYSSVNTFSVGDESAPKDNQNSNAEAIELSNNIKDVSEITETKVSVSIPSTSNTAVEDKSASKALSHENSNDEDIASSDNMKNACYITEIKDSSSSTPQATLESSNEVIVISDDSPISIEDSPVRDADVIREISKTNSDTNHSVESSVDSPQMSDVKCIEDSKADEYPDDLNPFGDDEEPKSQQQSLNPFGSDSEEESHIPLKPIPSPRMKKKIQPHSFDKEHLSNLRIERFTINPFGSDDDEEDTSGIKPPKPVARHKKVISAPKISLNPFCSDEESEEINKLPVPTPRNSRASVGAPEPKPRDAGGFLSLTTNSNFGSNSSISSGSAYGSARKKKPAPRPPIPTRFEDSSPGSLTSSPSQSLYPSPRSTPRSTAKRRAPPPPIFSSTPDPSRGDLPTLSDASSPIKLDSVAPTLISNKDNNDVLSTEERISEGHVEGSKFDKDEANRNRQNQNVPLNSPTDRFPILSTPNKSTFGRWKRRKGQAPPKPIPQKRTIKVLPMSEIRRELDLIEAQQQGLEKQGVRLEQIIRDKCEGEANNTVDDDIPIDVEDLILQLFELVNEKNELFRKQTELMYIRRQQRLEEEHADVEYQIRCLMLQPEANKTDSDKAREEELIKRLVDIVERRNEIVECLEMDRKREAEEDDSINIHINLYTSNRDGETSVPEDYNFEIEKQEKEKKKIKKDKKFKIKLKSKTDMDKDVDESESTLEKKKKFNLF